jgi:hypothetical protein
MRIVVFLGPTVAPNEAEAILPADYRPPASRGDVYAAARSRPWAIGIIDGSFHSVPSILHKEILWAMSRGIHVYGAASMGALRAAELAPFGMVGVGKVFEAFREGALTDDDEVAVVHGSSEAGYLRGSEAMVNIRATLERACACHVIDAEVSTALVQLAKSLFYPDRTFDRLLLAGIEHGVSQEQCARLSAWLPTGLVDVKRDDAVEMLRRIEADRERSPEPKQVAYRFHSTTIWEQHCNSFDGRPVGDAPGAEEFLGDEVLDELRMQGGDYAMERERALNRALAVELAVRQGHTLNATDTEQAVLAARGTRGLEDDRSLEAWLTRNGLDREGFTGLMQDEVLVRMIRARYYAWIPRYLYDSLRLSGKYARMEVRARDKQRLLARWGLSSPALADAELSEPELWQWFFETLLERPVPDDLPAYAASQDYGEVDLMRRAALRELLYRRKRGAPLEAPELMPHG